MIIKTNSVNKLKKALIRAAKEFYQSEIIDTEMYNLEIGAGKSFCDTNDWLDSKIKEWLI